MNHDSVLKDLKNICDKKDEVIKEKESEIADLWDIVFQEYIMLCYLIRKPIDLKIARMMISGDYHNSYCINQLLNVYVKNDRTLFGTDFPKYKFNIDIKYENED